MDLEAELERRDFDCRWLKIEPSACRPIWLTDDPHDLRDLRERSQRRHRDRWSSEKDGAHGFAYTRCHRRTLPRTRNGLRRLGPRAAPLPNAERGARAKLVGFMVPG